MPSLFGRRSAARALAAAVGIIAIQACASGRPAPSRAAAALALDRAEPGGATLAESARITSRELRALTGVTALEAVRRLRPEFFRVTPRRLDLAGPSTVSVYQDGVYFGDAELLSLIPIDQVVEIRRLTEVRARQLFGWRCSCDGGVIAVQTRR